MPSGPGPRVRRVRLRTLSEAECYARCYGGAATERVSVVRLPPGGAPHRRAASELRDAVEERLDARGPEAEAA